MCYIWLAVIVDSPPFDRPVFVQSTYTTCRSVSKLDSKVKRTYIEMTPSGRNGQTILLLSNVTNAEPLPLDPVKHPNCFRPLSVTNTKCRLVDKVSMYFTSSFIFIFIFFSSSSSIFTPLFNFSTGGGTRSTYDLRSCFAVSTPSNFVVSSFSHISLEELLSHLIRSVRKSYSRRH